MEPRIHAVQHIRRMRGGAQAHLLRASDNHYYVTKFQNNPQHIRVLASEYLATKLGILLGLPMPEARVIDVSETLIAATPALQIEVAGHFTPCASGPQFASRYIADPAADRIFDYLPMSMFERIENRGDFAKVLAFDKWTGNCDGRQAVFVMPPNRRFYRAVFIDQGYCFNSGEWAFPDLPLTGVYFSNHAYEGVTGWQSFEPTLSRIQGIDLAGIRRIAAEIPEEWYENDLLGMTRLLEALHGRRSSVPTLITAFCNSTRNPFPNWIAT